MTPPSLSIPASTARLAEVRRAVGAWARAAGLSGPAAERLVLAVDEAVTNAIHHSLGADGRRRVRVAPEPLAGGGLVVAVTYGGSRFDPATVASAPPAEAVRQRAVHGYGLHLMRRLTDDVRVEHVRGRNAVRLTVRG